MSTETSLWCGIDIAKKSFDVSLVTNQRIREISTIPVRKFKLTSGGAKSFLEWLARYCKRLEKGLDECHLVLEATGRYSKKFYEHVCKQFQGLRISIVNPAHVASFRKSMGKLDKTDPLDARVLGIFGRERNPDLYMPLSPQQEQLQELFRQRTFYVRQRVAQRARVDEAVTEIGKTVEEKAVNQTTEIINEIEEAIGNLIKEIKEIQKDVDLLMSIPGVGKLTAAAVLAELGDLRRFEKASQLSSFVGLAPLIRESGTSINYRRRISKAGNSQIRCCLYMSALHWTRKPDETLGADYARLVEAGKEKKCALLAITRKLLLLMRAIIISGKKYDRKIREKKKEMAMAA